MLINKRGESFKYNGVHYTIGEQVYANKNSMYNGLHESLRKYELVKIKIRTMKLLISIVILKFL